jgi:hypothetical protein
MIKNLTLTCDYIKQVDSRLHDNQIKVTLENVNNDFIADLDTKDIVYGQDVTALLEAIGADVVGEWFMGLGSK